MMDEKILEDKIIKSRIKELMDWSVNTGENYSLKATKNNGEVYLFEGEQESKGELIFSFETSSGLKPKLAEETLRSNYLAQKNNPQAFFLQGFNEYTRSLVGYKFQKNSDLIEAKKDLELHFSSGLDEIITKDVYAKFLSNF